MGTIVGRLVGLGGKVLGIIPKALLEHKTAKELSLYDRTRVLSSYSNRPYHEQ
jgi:hypothetical protein